MTVALEIAVVGATGVVGKALVEGIGGSAALGSVRLRVIADDAALGSEIDFRGRPLTVEALAGFDYAGVDLVLFAAGETVSRGEIAKALEAGCRVIDHSPLHRADRTVSIPLAGVNDADWGPFPRPGLVAAPSAGAAQLLAVLAPLHREFPIVEVDVVECVPVSADGRGGVERLARQTARLLGGSPLPAGEPAIAFNLRCDPDSAVAAALAAELARILPGAPRLAAFTRLFVPTFFGQAQLVRFALDDDLAEEAVAALIGAGEGVDCDPPRSPPAAANDPVGSDRLRVGGLRRLEPERPRYEYWSVCDNARRGVAWNSIRMLEALVKGYF